MAAEAYSAGTIFLQVVPVFRHTQDKVTAYAKGISKAMGDEMEKGGEDSGDKFNEGFERKVKQGGRNAAHSYVTEFQKQYDKALGDASKSLKPIELKAESNDVRRQIREIKTELDTLSGKKIRIEADAKDAENSIRVLEAHMAALEHDVKITGKADFTKAKASITAFVGFVESLKDRLEIEVKPDIDTRPAERALGAFETRLRASSEKAAKALGDPIDRRIKEIKAELEGLARTDIHIGLNDDVAAAKLDKLMAELYEISTNDVNVGIKVDTGRAFAELEAFARFRGELDGNTINERVDIDDKGALASLAALRGSGQGSANAFRAFNVVILAAVTLLPSLIPIIGALGGALLALGPILAGLGGGLAAVVIGFSGIATAVQALSAQSDKSAKDTDTATQQIKSAWYGVVDAREAVADAERSYARDSADAARAVAEARRQAAEAIRSALEDQQQAQEAYANSLVDVTDAQKALTEAKQQAKYDQEDLTDKIKDNKLSIRQGVLDAFDATNNLNAVMADGSSTTYDKEQAKIQHAQALQQLHELREEQQRLAAEKKKSDKQGVDGSDAVVAAQEAVTRAIQAQKDAEIKLQDADRNVTQTRLENARNIANALRTQHQTDADGRRSVAKAQEQLRRAQESYNEALKKTNDIGSAADQNVKNAMAALGPAGRQFARFIFSLKKGFYQLRDDIQAVMLPPIENAIKRIIKTYGPQMHDFLVMMGKGFGRFVTEFSKSLQGPAWRGFFEMLDKLGPTFGRQFGKAFIQWLQVFAQLMVIVAPFSLQLSKGLLGISNALSKWIQSKAGVSAVQGFMAYSAKVGPTVLRFLGDFVTTVIHLSKALAPWGLTVLKALDGFLEFLNHLSTANLGLLATSILGLVAAFQVTVGVVALLSAVLTVVLDPIGLIVVAVALLIVFVAVMAGRFKIVRQVLELVWKVVEVLVKVLFELAFGWIFLVVAIGKAIGQNQLFRSVVSTIWNYLKRLAEDVWGGITAAIGWVKGALEDLWTAAQPLLADFGDALDYLWHKIGKPILNAIGAGFQALGTAIRKVWNGFIWPILDLFIHIWLKLAQKVFLPLVKQMWGTFTHLGQIVKSVWNSFLHPAIKAFNDAMVFLWKKVFVPAGTAMGVAWGVFADGMKTVYDHTLKPLIDAFVDLMGGPQGLRSKFQAAVDAIGDIWSGLKKIFTAPIKFVIDTVVNDGLIAGFNKIANFVGSKPMSKISLPKGIENAYATGGVIPGYFPGGDNHHFYSPTAGKLSLSGGEAIMRPEFTNAVGGGWVNAVNSAAARGGAGAVKKLLNAGVGHYFSAGGVFNPHVLRNPDQKVYMDGKAIAAIAAAQVLLAEKLRHVDYYLMQGGFGGDHIAASGTSHNYPGVADIARSVGTIGFADQTALRKVAFDAWLRNVPGAAYVGSGAHAHSVSALSPGTQKSPQIAEYNAGQNGLDGGPDYGKRPAWLPGLAGMLGQFDLSKIDGGTGGKSHGFGLPHWLIDVAKNPLGFVTGLVTKPIKTMINRFGDTQLAHDIAGFPLHLVKATAEKVLDYIPGGGQIAKAAGFVWGKLSDLGNLEYGVASKVLDAPGNVMEHLGFARGGVLPYNGTMMYDAGGYLPPGLTQVVNLTGKPEPVFTNDQMEKLGKGKGFTYAPSFYDAKDPHEVIDDLEFTMRKLGRSSGRGPNAGGGRS